MQLFWKMFINLNTTHKIIAVKWESFLCVVYSAEKDQKYSVMLNHWRKTNSQNEIQFMTVVLVLESKDMSFHDIHIQKL